MEKKRIKNKFDKFNLIIAIISLVTALFGWIFSSQEINTYMQKYIYSIEHTKIALYQSTVDYINSQSTPTYATKIPINKTQLVTSTPRPNTYDIQTEINKLQTDITDIQQELAGSDQGYYSPDIAAINQQVSTIDSRLFNLEQVVLDDPAKAISIVLINKDIESITQRQNSDVQSLRDEIARLYSLNLWFLGIMIPIVISIIGLAVRNIFGEKNADIIFKQNKKEKTE